jgi:hypothetical protein
MAIHTAFTGRDTNIIKATILQMAKKSLMTLTPYPAMSFDDVLDMLGVKGEQRRFMRDGRLIVDIGNAANVAWVDIGSVRLFITVDGSNAPLMPRNVELDPDWMQNSEAGRQIAQRVEQMAAIADDWGCVKHVWSELNALLGSEAQMRFVWPSILAIMGAADDEGLSRKREKLLPLKVPGSMPTVPVGLRALIRRASTVVAMSAFLPPRSDTADVSGRVKLSMATQYKEAPDGYYSLNLED